jgi:hypothetical protein
MNHIDDLFTHAGETGQSPTEALDTQLDYRVAAGEQQPKGAMRGLIGSFALLVTNDEKANQWQARFDAWRERKRTASAQRRATKRERRHLKYGNLDCLRFEDGTSLSTTNQPAYATTPAPEQAAIVPRQVANTNVYRSNFSENQPADQPPLSSAEYDEIMAGAVTRARAALGEIPVAHMYQPPAEQPHTEPNMSDAQLIERLNHAFNQPAQEPDRSGHVGRHRAPDDLTSTKA